MADPRRNRPGPSSVAPGAGTAASGVVVGRIEPAADAVLPDGALLRQLRDGDDGALELLLERYWPGVHAYAQRRTGSHDLAADVAQEAFCRLWERRSTWQRDGSVRGLLYRLARNAAVTLHRRQRARARAADGWAELQRARVAGPVPAERAELRAALARAVDALPARRREVFQLRMLDDLSYEEIADVMGTSRQTVANQFSLALATLRRTLAHLLD